MSILNSVVQAPATAAPHLIRELPVLVILPHNRCHCRCVMCDIWRIRQTREITAQDMEPHMASLRQLKVGWVVFSGGEPLMHSDLWTLTRMLHREGIRTTLLTAGLTLQPFAARVAEEFDDVIVSLDGPPEIHDRIRGRAGAYQRLKGGIQALRRIRPSLPINARCTVQKGNHRHLRAVVASALELSLSSLSFLAADVRSEAFNRATGWSMDKLSEVVLEAHESDALINELDRLILEYPQLIRQGFIHESVEKLRRIGLHFRAELGETAPVAPRCNAPWVSAVIESDGAVRPCFFHRPIGSLQGGTLAETLNGDEAVRFRSQLDVSTNPICQRCVCALFLEGATAKPPSTGGGKKRGILPLESATI